MKKQIGAIIVIFLIMLGVLGTTAYGSGVTISQTTTGSTTDLSHPSAYLVDGKVGTYWCLQSDATQGWSQLNLAKPTLIYGLKLSGNLGPATKLTVEYQSDGAWLPFTAATLTTLPDTGRIDLSWDRVVTQTLRIRLSSSTSVSGYLSEVEVLGETATSILHRLQPEQITATNTSPNAPVSFLSDANTYTGWQLCDSASHGTAIFEFPATSTINNIKLYFNSVFSGNIILEAFINNTWEQIATVSNQATGWYRLDLSGKTIATMKVRLTVSGCSGVDTSLSEVEFWGYGDFRGNIRKSIGDQEAITISPSDNTSNTVIANGELKVLYSSSNATAITNSIQHSLKLYNTGSTTINLSDVKLRYWYTNETAKSQVASVYWSTVGSQNITTQFVTVANKENADTYLELGFSAVAGTLAPGSYVEVKLGLNANDWTSYNQANDFSFASTTSYKENATYTGYLNDTRVWGKEPNSTIDNSVNLQFTKPMVTVLGNQAADGCLKILHQSANTVATTNSLQANLKFENTGYETLDLTKVKLRYWYTNDTKKTQTANIYWASSGTSYVTTKFVTVDNTGTTADTYLELGFRTGTLVPGATVEIKFGINASDWSNYKQTNDYSFASVSSTYGENTKVTGYVDDQLAWGIEPDTRSVFDNATYRLELAFVGTLINNAVVELNNTKLELKPGLTTNDRTIYCCQLTAAELWNGVNYLRIKPFSTAVTLENAFITRQVPDGECSVALEGLSDGLLLTATTPAATEWQFDQPIALEEATVTTTDNSVARLYAWVNDNWSELTNPQSLDWGTRYTGPVTTSKLKLEVGGTVGEIIIKGSVATNQTPSVQIFWPMNGEEIGLQGWANQELIGLVDNSKATVNVNGTNVTLDGHYFNFPLSKIAVDNGKTLTITATARDSSNRTGSASVAVTAGEYSEVKVDQTKALVYTTASTYTISGTINNNVTQYQINVAGNSATISSNRFVTSVSLKEGLNLIEIQAIKNGKLVKTFYRRVVRNSEVLALTIKSPESGTYFNTQTVTVTGSIKGVAPLQVSVNGTAATVSGNTYTAAVTLSDGSNQIFVVGRDAAGSTTTKTVTVNLDTAAPTITGVTPAEGALFNTSAVTAAATVTDTNPFWVTINGQAVRGNGGIYQAILSLADGNQTITVTAQDIAGNIATFTVHTLVDTVGPVNFTPVANVTGWTTNNKPMITFSTTDSGSGLDHYEISVDDGATLGVVTSPYQFTNALADGELTVKVKAIDKAGNVTIGTVKVCIDTTAPSVPADFEVISGVGRMILEWGGEDPSGEIVGYRITRTPNYSSGSFLEIMRASTTSDLRKYVDEAVTTDTEYTYTVQAIDHAGNYSEVTKALTAKVGSLTKKITTNGGTYKFDNCQVTIPEGAIDFAGQIIIKEAEKSLPNNSYATKISPAYQFTLLDQDGKEVETQFDNFVTMKVSYDDLVIPDGFNEGNLGVYWYNEDGEYWEKLDYTKYEFGTKTLTVKLHHFSDYQVMASTYMSPSLDSYYNMGVSPNQAYFQDNTENVSPYTGALSVTATDFKLPGRNGLSMIIKRLYDSTAAEQEKMIEANPDADQKIPIDTFGYGWSLNIPWIEQTDKGRFVRLPEGQTVKIENISEYHAGIHFRLKYQDKAYTLTMSDGTKYVFDTLGRVITQTDPSGKNVITYEYNNREISKITDTVGHSMQFEYTTSGSRRVISKITIGDRSVSYHYDSSGNLIAVDDPLDRKTSYSYQSQTYKTGTRNGLSGEDTFSYSFFLLNSIIYPTGAKSIYTYESLNQSHSEKYAVRVKHFFNWKVASVKVYYYGMKTLVKKQQVAGKETTFTYQMNSALGSFQNENFVPAYTYMVSSQSTEGDRRVQSTFQQVEGSSLVDTPSDIDNYKGPLLTRYKTEIGASQMVEMITNKYNVPLRAVIEENHYRGGLLVYAVTKSYDSWGNLISGSDGSRNLKETYTFYKQDNLDIKNLVATHTVNNFNPLTNATATVITTYKYDDQLGKPLTVTINDGSQDKVTRFTYDSWGNLKTKIDEANANLQTEIFYDDTYHAFPVKQTIYGVVDADGNTRDITTEAAFNAETGLKQWTKDARGYVTSYEYDKLNRVTKIVLPDDDQDSTNNPYREYIFDDTNNTCELYNEKRQKTTYKFDGLGRLTQVVNDTTLFSGGVITQYQYDEFGRISSVTDPQGNITTYTYDGLNRVTKVIYPDGATVSLSYDDATNLTTLTDENGGVVCEQKDWAGRLTFAKQYCQYDGFTATYSWRYIYDSLGNQLRQINPQASQIDQEFDALGHLIAVKLPTANLILPGTNTANDYQSQVTYEYNTAGFKTGTISANENAKGTKRETKYTYDQLGRVITTTVQVEDVITNEMPTATTKFYYDANGNKVKVVDANNQTWAYKYSARGQLLSSEDPSGNIIRYQYDLLGNKTAVTDPRGNGSDSSFTTWYEYDDLNRLVKTILPDATPDDLSDNPYTEVTYDANGNKLTERDPNGVVTSYTYTARNWVKTAIKGGQLKLTYVYDAKGNQIEVHDTVDNVTKKVYDSLGRVRKKSHIGIYAVNETYSYDEVGNQIAITDGRNNTTTYTYNSLGFVTGVTDPLKNRTQYFYDPNGNRVKVITPNNLVLQNNYDELNRLNEQIDSLSQSIKTSYDAVGNRKQMVDRRGTTWVYQYYPNNLLKRIDLTGTDGSNYYVEYTYDAAGNRQDTKDSANTIRYNYQDGSYHADPQNRLNTIDRSFDGVTYQTAYQYDQSGLLKKIKYPEATDWLTYNYNELNQLCEVKGFTAAQGMTYDANGALKTLTYANGITANYKYDNNLRVEDYQVTLNGTTLLQQKYTYDACHNITAINEASNTKTYGYDANNQLTCAVNSEELLDTTATPGTYGSKTGDYLGAYALDYSSAATTAMFSLDYNSSSIGIDFGAVATGVKQIQLIPDQAYRTHRIAERTLELYTSSDNVTYTIVPKAKWTFVKDEQGVITVTLTERTTARYLKVHVKFDDRDNKFKAMDKATFINDLAKMLRVYQEGTTRTEEYAYDAGGNRILHQLTLVQTTSYNSTYYTNSNRLKTDGKYAFIYDADGNLLKKGNKFTINGDTVTLTTSGDEVEYWQYTYDLLNRLTAVSKNGTLVAEYAYNPEGLRVVKKVGNVTTHYIFEGTEPIIEKNLATGKVKSYVYAFGKYLARVDGVIGNATASKYFYHVDQLGSIRVVTNQDGKTVYQTDYHGFGSRYGAMGDFNEEHGFTGKEYDSGTGLYYYNSRWYDPELGRFISEDPAADPNNPNLYSYCGNNPVIRNDPNGQFAWLAIPIYAAIQGAVTKHTGGDFWTGAQIGAIAGLISAGVSYGVSSVISNTLAQSMVSSAISGGLVNEMYGGDFWDGAGTGALEGGLLWGETKINFLSEEAVDVDFGWLKKAAIKGLNSGVKTIVTVAHDDFWDEAAEGFVKSAIGTLGTKLNQEYGNDSWYGKAFNAGICNAISESVLNSDSFAGIRDSFWGGFGGSTTDSLETKMTTYVQHWYSKTAMSGLSGGIGAAVFGGSFKDGFQERGNKSLYAAAGRGFAKISSVSNWAKEALWQDALITGLKGGITASYDSKDNFGSGFAKAFGKSKLAEDALTALKNYGQAQFKQLSF